MFLPFFVFFRFSQMTEKNPPAAPWVRFLLHRQTAFDLRLWDLVEHIFVGNLWLIFKLMLSSTSLGNASISGLISKVFQNWWVFHSLTILWEDNLCFTCFNFLKGLSKIYTRACLTPRNVDRQLSNEKKHGCLGYIGDYTVYYPVILGL